MSLPYLRLKEILGNSVTLSFCLTQDYSLNPVLSIRLQHGNVHSDISKIIHQRPWASPLCQWRHEELLWKPGSLWGQFGQRAHITSQPLGMRGPEWQGNLMRQRFVYLEKSTPWNQAQIFCPNLNTADSKRTFLEKPARYKSLFLWPAQLHWNQTTGITLKSPHWKLEACAGTEVRKENW